MKRPAAATSVGGNGRSGCPLLLVDKQVTAASLGSSRVAQAPRATPYAAVTPIGGCRPPARLPRLEIDPCLNDRQRWWQRAGLAPPGVRDASAGAIQRIRAPNASGRVAPSESVGVHEPGIRPPALIASGPQYRRRRLERQGAGVDASACVPVSSRVRRCAGRVGAPWTCTGAPHRRAWHRAKAFFLLTRR
jgi:hypothetical protein